MKNGTGLTEGKRIVNMKKLALCLILGSAAVLAVMGLAFCWMCPAGVGMRAGSPHWMVVGNLLGLALGGLAVAFGWRRWLKVAPIVVVAWIGLVVYAATQPLVNGCVGWIRFGPVAFSVWEALPLVVGLSAAWISWKFNFRPFVTMLILSLPFVASFGTGIVANESRLQRVKAFFAESAESVPMDAMDLPRRYLQDQSVSVVRGAKWFGKTELAPNILPCAATAAMPAKAAATFGKWYLALLCGLFGLMGAGLAMAWASVCDSARRSLVLAQGLMIVGTMVVSFLGCLGVTPILMCGIPWASFGGSLAAFSWLALGVLESAMLDKNSSPRGLSEREVLAIVGAAVLWTILLLCPLCRL